MAEKQTAANRSRSPDDHQVSAQDAAPNALDVGNLALEPDRQTSHTDGTTGHTVKISPLFDAAISEQNIAEHSNAIAPAPTNIGALRGNQVGSSATWLRRQKRRSFNLAVIKVVLPLIAAVIVWYLIHWWYIHNREAVINVPTPDQPSTAMPMVTVNNFKYSSADSQNRPYSITADSAIQPQDKAVDAVNLVQPKADFTLSGDHWMKITATSGLYHRNADTVDLDGNVQLFHDNGMTFNTSHAQIDLKAKIAGGSEPVEGRNATTIINSEGFRVLDSGDVIIFTGKSKLQLLGKGKDGNQ